MKSVISFAAALLGLIGITVAAAGENNARLAEKRGLSLMALG